MYRFIAKFMNMDNGEEVTRNVEVDCTPLDADCMDNMPEELFAWREATTKAYSLIQKDEYLVSVELLSC